MSHKAGKWKSDSDNTSGADIFWGIVGFIILIIIVQGN